MSEPRYLGCYNGRLVGAQFVVDVAHSPNVAGNRNQITMLAGADDGSVPMDATVSHVQRNRRSARAKHALGDGATEDLINDQLVLTRSCYNPQIVGSMISAGHVIDFVVMPTNVTVDFDVRVTIPITITVAMVVISARWSSNNEG
jgi:hypothetical protein